MNRGVNDLRELRRQRRLAGWRVRADDTIRETNPRTAGGQAYPSSPIDLYSSGSGRLKTEQHVPQVHGNKYLVEHSVTLTVSNYEVADGGAEILWATEDGAPRERHGWTQISLPQSALPSDLTGTLDINLSWRWRDGYRDDGAVTITVGGDTETFTPPLALNGGPIDEIALQIVAGETVTVTFPNGSGEPQYLDATLQMEVRETRRGQPPIAGGAWWLGYDTDEIDLVDEEGEVLLTIPSPTSSVTGLVVIGGSLWVTSWTENKVWELNPADGTVLSSFDLPAGDEPFGLATDGTNLWYGADRSPEEVVEVTTAGVEVGSFETVAAAGVASLDWLDSDLWAAYTALDGDGSSGPDVERIDSTDGTVLEELIDDFEGSLYDLSSANGALHMAIYTPATNYAVAQIDMGDGSYASVFASPRNGASATLQALARAS